MVVVMQDISGKWNERVLHTSVLSTQQDIPEHEGLFDHTTLLPVQLLTRLLVSSLFKSMLI